jgi:hypothetical protein
VFGIVSEDNGNIEDFRVQRLGGVAAKASWRMNGWLGGWLEPPPGQQKRLLNRKLNLFHDQEDKLE